MMRTGRQVSRIACALLMVALSCAAQEKQAGAQTLSAEERRIADYVDAHFEDAVRLLEQTVNVESATQNLEGVKRVGRIFQSEFRALGFNAKWIEMPPQMGRAGHFFAEHTGTRGRRLLLIGHLDTVLEGKRFVRDGQVARGSGTVDMKGGDIVLLYALKALHSTGALRGSRIIVIMTGDEENVGSPLEVSRRDLLEAARRSDVALGFEAGIENTATVARRGSSDWRLQVTAATGHSSGIFSEGVGSGAIFEAARILNAFHEQLRGEQYLTFNPSVIAGGTDVTFDNRDDHGAATGKTNVIARTVVVRGDLRFISEKQRDAAKARMTDIVSRSLPQTKSEITFEDNYPAMSPTPENYALLKTLDQASRDLGLGSVEAFDPGGRGAGDISFVAPFISGLDGLGARGGGSHAADEFAELDTLSIQIKRAALLIYRLTRQ
ncbi:MAG TPA: M20/M25/M40 family metallo-hydrolase [Pyrinomonadaceae bacterium]